MSAARAGHSATLLPNDKVLVTGGSNTFASASLYDPATRTWSAAASTSIPRTGSTATLLADGRVLLAGGANSVPTPYTLVELHDPVTNMWSVAASMNTARSLHTATLLPDGKVLVAGGSSGSGVIATTEIYDPASDEWTVSGDLTTARFRHTATLLPDGSVLVTGGYEGSGSTATAERYDASSDTWSSTPHMNAGRSGHTATLLPSGKVLVTGGFGAPFFPLTGAELYDPTSDLWLPAATMGVARDRHTATLLPSGDVLVAGSANGRPTQSAELYDPATNGWRLTASMATGRESHSATLLASGFVLVTGGRDLAGAALASTEEYGVDSIAPPLVGLSATDPASPANHNSALVRGSAEAGSTVRLYATADCSGSVVAEGTAASLASPGLAATVADDSTTTFHATASDKYTNTSPCSASSLTYVEDSTAPQTGIDAGPPAISGSAVAVAFSTSEPGPAARLECRLDGGVFAPCTSPASYGSLPDGPHVFTARAIDAAGNVDATPASHAWAVDTAAPVARFAAAPNPALAGRVVTFDASGSSDAGTPITRHEWDLEGDGTFERDTGGVASTTRIYADPGTYAAQLRVTDSAGRSAVTRGDQRVTTDGRGGRLPAVSINSGAAYTNDPKVAIKALWPSFAGRMLVSNDGGFEHAQAFALHATTPWTLDSTGAERVPKLVYVRFTRGLTVSETYIDDIILDQRAPTVTSARVTPRKGGGVPLLRVRARDRGLSGVGSVQVTNNRRDPRAKFRAHRATIKLNKRRGERRLSLRKPIYVRVRDRAGSLSPWRLARRR